MVFTLWVSQGLSGTVLAHDGSAPSVSDSSIAPRHSLLKPARPSESVSLPLSEGGKLSATKEVAQKKSLKKKVKPAAKDPGSSSKAAEAGGATAAEPAGSIQMQTGTKDQGSDGMKTASPSPSAVPALTGAGMAVMSGAAALTGAAASTGAMAAAASPSARLGSVVGGPAGGRVCRKHAVSFYGSGYDRAWLARATGWMVDEPISRCRAGWPASFTEANLDSGRYIRPTIEFRDVFADILTKHFGVSPTELGAVLPGHVHTPVGLFV